MRGDFKPPEPGKQRGGGDAHILHGEAGGNGGAERPFAVDIVGAEAGEFGVDQKSADAAVFIVDLGPDDGDVGKGAAGDPHFFAVQDVVAAIFFCARAHAAGIGTEVRLGEAEAAEFFSRGHLRQPFIFLLVGTEGVDGIHAQGGLHADEAAHAGVAALGLLHDQAIFNIVHAGTTVALDGGAIKTKLAHGTDQFFGEAAFAIAFLNDGDEVILNKLAGGIADEALVFTQQRVETDKVDTFKFESHTVFSVDKSANTLG